jgi:hypothetical protein
MSKERIQWPATETGRLRILWLKEINKDMEGRKICERKVTEAKMN